MAPLLRLRAQGSAAREDAYHLRNVRLLLQRRGKRLLLLASSASASSERVDESEKEGKAEEQLLLDTVHRIRAPRCLCQVSQ